MNAQNKITVKKEGCFCGMGLQIKIFSVNIDRINVFEGTIAECYAYIELFERGVLEGK